MFENALLGTIDRIQDQSVFAEFDVISSLMDAYIKYDMIVESSTDIDSFNFAFIQEADEDVEDMGDMTVKTRTQKFANSRFGSKIVNFIEMIKNIFKEIAYLIRKKLLDRRVKNIAEMYENKTGDQSIPFMYKNVSEAEDQYNRLAYAVSRVSQQIQNDDIMGMAKEMPELSVNFDSFVKTMQIEKVRDFENANSYLTQVCGNNKCTIPEFKSYFKHVSETYDIIALVALLVSAGCNKILDKYKRKSDDPSIKNFDYTPMKKLGNTMLTFVSKDIKRHVQYLKALYAILKEGEAASNAKEKAKATTADAAAAPA